MSQRKPLCRRCGTIVLDAWPGVLLLSRPDRPARTLALCAECFDVVENIVRPTIEPRLPELEPAGA